MSSGDLAYPTKYELIEALVMCKRKFVDRFAQERGVFVFRATLEYLADQLSRLFLDEDDLNEIREHAYRNRNKKITVGFVVASVSADFDPKNIIDELRSSPPNTHASLSAVTQVNETLISGALEYEVNKPGRINLLQNENRHVTYSIEAKENNTYQVFVEALSSSDARYFESMFKGAVKDEANLNIINFLMLSSSDTIRFFDDLSEAGLGSDWRKTRVNELTFRRSTESSDDDGDEEHKEASNEFLSVINRAILEGKDLRDNPFVKQSEKDGYRFSAMTIEYAEKKLGHIIEMRAEFKLRPEVFEVKVASYRKNIKEGDVERLEADELSQEDEQRLIQSFWYAAKGVYDNLVSATNIPATNTDDLPIPAAIGTESADFA